MKKYLIFFIALSFFSGNAQTADSVKQKNPKTSHHHTHGKSKNNRHGARFYSHKHQDGKNHKEFKKHRGQGEHRKGKENQK